MMMMMGEPTRSHPSIQIPPWDPYDEIASPPSHLTSPYPVSGVSSVNFNGNATSPNGDHNNPFTLNEVFSALSRFLPSNEFATQADLFGEDSDFPFDSFSCDNFRMYDFKVRRCARGRSHDWTECPYAHPGEKARRRDPRKYSYSGTACPEFRKGSCKKGDACEFAHGVFECWLHPDRYRTQACKDGMDCRRRVCFFAHSPDQLRVVTQPSPKSRWNEMPFDGYDGSPIRRGTFDAYLSNASTFQSPPSSPPSDSPPHSPATGSYNSMSELVANMRSLQLAKAKASTSPSAASWGGVVPSCFGSPRGTASLRHGFYSLPTTPTRGPTRSGLGCHELWDNNTTCEEEPAMERVESGRDLRARIYAKLSRENSLGRRTGTAGSVSAGPDVGWISELVK